MPSREFMRRQVNRSRFSRRQVSSITVCILWGLHAAPQSGVTYPMSSSCWVLGSRPALGGIRPPLACTPLFAPRHSGPFRPMIEDAHPPPDHGDLRAPVSRSRLGQRSYRRRRALHAAHSWVRSLAWRLSAALAGGALACSLHAAAALPLYASTPCCDSASSNSSHPRSRYCWCKPGPRAWEESLQAWLPLRPAKQHDTKHGVVRTIKAARSMKGWMGRQSGAQRWRRRLEGAAGAWQAPVPMAPQKLKGAMSCCHSASKAACICCTAWRCGEPSGKGAMLRVGVGGGSGWVGVGSPPDEPHRHPSPAACSLPCPALAQSACQTPCRRTRWRTCARRQRPGPGGARRRLHPGAAPRWPGPAPAPRPAWDGTRKVWQRGVGWGGVARWSRPEWRSLVCRTRSRPLSTSAHRVQLRLHDGRRVRQRG